jgi:hypothetical protein
VKFPSIRRSAILALIVATVAVGATTTVARAQETVSTYRVTVPGGTQFDFQSNPKWVMVPGTRVAMVRDDMRPNQDFFRYNNRYYVQSNGTWYRSNRWNGRYTAVNERSLPAQFRQVPQQHWRAYPPGWQKQQMKQQQRRNR